MGRVVSLSDGCRAARAVSLTLLLPWVAMSAELQLYRSEGDAKTWTACGPVTEPSQHPGHFLRLRDGRLMLTYGNRTADRGVDVRFSADEGKTWSRPVRVVDFQEDGGYPSSVQLPDGQVLTAYYASKTAYHGRYHIGVVIWDPAAIEIENVSSR